MTPAVTDLFGEVPISTDDVRAWLCAVPRINPDSERAEHYARSYAVADKIRRAKLEGWFDAVVAPREPPAGHWWLRFRWD